MRKRLLISTGSLFFLISGLAAQVDPYWQDVSSPARPPIRRHCALAYDTSRARTVLFGGYAGIEFSDTWEWDGVNWIQMTPNTSPPARAGHALVFDRSSGAVVLFGGMTNGFPSFSDTWEWDGVNWVQRHPSVSPPARRDHALVYDEGRSRVVLFGGSTVGNLYLADTWEWDGTQWVYRTPSTTPPGRYGHAMAYDAARDRVVLFGGYTSTGKSRDTWEWDGNEWQQQSPSTSPSARHYTSAAYDQSRARVILFGGNIGPTANDNLSDTWEWLGSHWARQFPTLSPSSRFLHALSYHEASGRILLFGGYGSSQYWNDTWLYGLPAETTCDDADNNGNGTTDEGCDDDNDDYCDDSMTVIGQPTECVLGAGDCDDDEFATYPGALETNDGLDNQCAGEEGQGLVDEITGLTTMGDSNDLCWPEQPLATDYEVLRLEGLGPQDSCSLFPSFSSCWNDASEPSRGLTFYYLVRPTLPYLGSLGTTSSGIERNPVCPN